MTGRPDYDVDDLVVCVDVSRTPPGIPGGSAGGRHLVLGRVYTVAGITPDHYFDGKWVTILVEARSTDRTNGFHASRFRKVDPLPDSLTSLLASKPVREPVPA